MTWQVYMVLQTMDKIVRYMRKILFYVLRHVTSDVSWWRHQNHTLKMQSYVKVQRIKIFPNNGPNDTVMSP